MIQSINDEPKPGILKGSTLQRTEGNTSLDIIETSLGQLIPLPNGFREKKHV